VLGTLIPSILVIKRLCKKGTSREVRMKVIKRHISFLVIYLICIVQVIEDQTHFIEEYYSKENGWDEEISEKARDIVDYLFNATGILLAMIRLIEPFVWSHLVEDIKRLFRFLTC
jgi:hypothetical protein